MKMALFPLTVTVLTLTSLMSMNVSISAQRGMQVEGVEDIPPGTSRQTEADLWLEMLSADDGGRALAADDVVRLGDQLKVCFLSTEAGYVTLWSRDSAGKVVRLYPNQFTPGGESADGMAITPNQQICVGDDEHFRLRVVEPRGENWVYLHWTPDVATSLPGDAFMDMDEFTRSIDQRSMGNTDNYADRRVRFFIE